MDAKFHKKVLSRKKGELTTARRFLVAKGGKLYSFDGDFNAYATQTDLEDGVYGFSEDKLVKIDNVSMEEFPEIRTPKGETKEIELKLNASDIQRLRSYVGTASGSEYAQKLHLFTHKGVVYLFTTDNHNLALCKPVDFPKDLPDIELSLSPNFMKFLPKKGEVSLKIGFDKDNNVRVTCDDFEFYTKGTGDIPNVVNLLGGADLGYVYSIPYSELKKAFCEVTKDVEKNRMDFVSVEFEFKEDKLLLSCGNKVARVPVNFALKSLKSHDSNWWENKSFTIHAPFALDEDEKKKYPYFLKMTADRLKSILDNFKGDNVHLHLPNTYGNFVIGDDVMVDELRRGVPLERQEREHPQVKEEKPAKEEKPQEVEATKAEPAEEQAQTEPVKEQTQVEPVKEEPEQAVSPKPEGKPKVVRPYSLFEYTGSKVERVLRSKNVKPRYAESELSGVKVFLSRFWLKIDEKVAEANGLKANLRGIVVKEEGQRFFCAPLTHKNNFYELGKYGLKMVFASGGKNMYRLYSNFNLGGKSVTNYATIDGLLGEIKRLREQGVRVFMSNSVAREVRKFIEAKEAPQYGR